MSSPVIGSYFWEILYAHRYQISKVSAEHPGRQQVHIKFWLSCLASAQLKRPLALGQPFL